MGTGGFVIWRHVRSVLRVLSGKHKSAAGACRRLPPERRPPARRMLRFQQKRAGSEIGAPLLPSKSGAVGGCALRPQLPDCHLPPNRQ
jgi:hypothetical protein